MKRSTIKLLAEETVAIVERGHYQAASGRAVNLAPAIRACLDATTLLTPEEVRSARRRGLARPPLPAGATTRFEVTNETTLAAVARVLGDGIGPVAALNFASARNPGGGFLNGAWAQEESLAIASALHASLLRAPEFYDRHRASASLLYSDAMIVSPDCPIFRDDDGRLRDEPRFATFLTSPAPNAGAIRDKRSAEADQVASTLSRRAELVVGLAAAIGVRSLILGAWGCGVFQNDPAMVARAFADSLRGLFADRFERVVFAVLDHSADAPTYQAFAEVFATSG